MPENAPRTACFGRNDLMHTDTIANRTFAEIEIGEKVSLTRTM